MKSRPTLFGVDFSSSPTRRKPIVAAQGRLAMIGGHLALCAESFCRYESLDSFDAWLRQPGPWVGGFDIPFALPRELLQTSGWPYSSWAEHMQHMQSLSRAQMVTAFKVFCDARPTGSKFAHRATDRPAESSPSMKWVNPPVAFMLHAGATRLFQAGVHVPYLHETGSSKVALETYPGFFARQIVGRASYKSDDVAKQTNERAAARNAIVAAMEDGRHSLGLAVVFAKDVREQALTDASGDCLDACICLLQAAWAQQQHERNPNQPYGLPLETDCIEGWIVSVPCSPN